MRKLFVGLDTSNYTTSCAVCDDAGRVLLNQKRLLPVKSGERGLRQSDAVFLHVKAMEQIAPALHAVLQDAGAAPCEIAAVGASIAPRDEEGSYMPCFLVGSHTAQMLAAVLNVPSFTFSHQAGHIMAAAHSVCENSVDAAGRAHSYTLPVWIGAPFLAFHVSGGTTDILYVQPDEEKILRITRLGGALDIHAGQAIDRAGVAMGLPFPAGSSMDSMAMEAGRDAVRERYPLSIHGLDCNLSGIENKALALWKKENSLQRVSVYVLDAIGRTLVGLTKTVKEQYPQCPVLYAGGVMSSRYLQSYLSPYGYFAAGSCASDNAVGTALLTRAAWMRKQNER